MKKIYLITMFALMSIGGYCQQWTKMHGSNTPNSTGHFGTQGVFDSLNDPPALYEPCQWTDKQGKFWLFGGVDSAYWNIYGDLWEFDPTINQWAWIRGSGMPSDPPVYGTKGIPSPLNTPGSRSWGVPSFVDTSGNLWLFGGTTNTGNPNDLWKYTIATNEWTWMKGDTIPSHGIIQVEDITNNPVGRSETDAAWTDDNNNLWFFGRQSNMSDLWRFNISTNSWTWMKGPYYQNFVDVYGQLGVPDSSNCPGGRDCWTAWKDSHDDLWIFGGAEGISTYPLQNDLWRYHIATNEWTWMSGSNHTDNGFYGAQCVPAMTNRPGCRGESRSCWIRNCDNFIFFGGGGTGIFNDMWNYNLGTNEWTEVHEINPPSGRAGAVSWKDNSGNLWLFGGEGGGIIIYNDLWKFVPDPNCPSITNQTISSFTVDTLSGCKPLHVHFTNTSTNATSYHWEFSGGGTSDSISPTRSFGQSGTYTATLIAYDSTACGVFTDTSSQTYYYTVFIPPAQPHIIQNGDTLTITNFTTGLQWLDYSIPMPGDTNSVLIVTHTGCYQAIETDIHGCTEKSDVTCINFTGIPVINDNHGISIYPNPNDGTFTLSIHSPMSIENYQLSIENVLGQEIYRQTMSGTDNIIDVSMWSEGIYFYEVRSMNEIMRGKFVKE